MIQAMILGLRQPERYAVRRLLVSAHNELKVQHPCLAVAITESHDLCEIDKYAMVLTLPSLLINNKLVCSGRFPTRQEVLTWLVEALQS